MKLKILTVLKISLCAAVLVGCENVAQSHAEATTSETDLSVEPDHIVLQKLKMASGDHETINDVMEKLIGSWHQSPDNFSEDNKAWMLENKVSDFYDTFSWGTNKAWIDFGDFRVVDGVAEQTGTGMISWHTGFEHLRFREAGARGGFVDGMLEIKDENTFIRHYEFFNPKGEVSYNSDTWTFDPQNPDCFIWQSTAYEDGVPKDYPGRKFCKTE